MLSVSYISIGDIKPADRNARTHSPEQIRQIQRSISEFGWTNPILVDEGSVIIAGHGRLEAAKLAGLASVPTITLTGLSATQKRALALADNKLALNAGWDDGLLRLELGELGLDGFDLSMIGFSKDELAALFVDKTVGLTDPDDVPDAPEPVTVLGDVWVLGRHRLVCGDSTDAGTVAAALNGVRPHLMVTDPPYGVSYDAEWRKAALPDTNLPTATRAPIRQSKSSRSSVRSASSVGPIRSWSTSPAKSRLTPSQANRSGPKPQHDRAARGHRIP